MQVTQIRGLCTTAPLASRLMALRVQARMQAGFSQWRQYTGAATPSSVRVMRMPGWRRMKAHTASQVSQPMQAA